MENRSVCPLLARRSMPTGSTHWRSNFVCRGTPRDNSDTTARQVSSAALLSRKARRQDAWRLSAPGISSLEFSRQSSGNSPFRRPPILFWNFLHPGCAPILGHLLTTSRWERLSGRYQIKWRAPFRPRMRRDVARLGGAVLQSGIRSGTGDSHRETDIAKPDSFPRASLLEPELVPWRPRTKGYVFSAARIPRGMALTRDEAGSSKTRRHGSREARRIA